MRRHKIPYLATSPQETITKYPTSFNEIMHEKRDFVPFSFTSSAEVPEPEHTKFGQIVHARFRKYY